ncbi:MAG: M3 family oligoendopeptidase [Flavobacteriales bacterium]
MASTGTDLPVRPPRRFIAQDLQIDAWSKLEPYFSTLLNRDLLSLADLEQWLQDRSELEAVVEEEGAWRYIRMTINTKDDKAVEAYEFFVTEIEPRIAPYADKLNRKMMDCSFVNKLEKPGYSIYRRAIAQELKLFREENVPLIAQIQKESQRYGAITGAQSVVYKNEEITMPRAATFLKSTDRNEREFIYQLIVNRREKDTAALDELFELLRDLRHSVSLNAGYANYRDYMFDALGRFDYSVSDCEDFHESIRTEILPITKGFMEERKERLQLDRLRPWDTEVDITGKPALKPFHGARELVDRSIRSMVRVQPYFGECIRIMEQMGHLDLESKDGKAPGGYNYPLYEIGVPFIFMNAVDSQRDLVTMVHEGGHAVHSFLTRDLELTAFKGTPSEVAELASMSMELLSMDAWDEFYTNAEELKRARKDQLEKILSILPWIATVDKFQHWLYVNSKHSSAERAEAWMKIQDEFSTHTVDYSGYEHSRKSAWQKQLHIYEVPFYYIEYGMAQLGAIAIWRNYKKDPANAVKAYTEALKLGYTKSIPEIYETAGIRFNFSRGYVKELADFVKSELEKLND